MIDFHTHFGTLLINEVGLRPAELVRECDKNGVGKACVMAVESPEECHYYVTSNQVLRGCARHWDRLIPFCGVDPRIGRPGDAVIHHRLAECRKAGARGVGEIIAGLPINHSRMAEIYRAAGDLGMPVLLHISESHCFDELGFPNFRKVLDKFSETIFVAHAYHWWAEIDASVTYEDRVTYPYHAPVVPGAVHKMLSKHGNLYADLSGGSGYNALGRQEDGGKAFCEEFQTRLLLGSDVMRFGQDCPIFDHIRGLGLSDEAFRLITQGNAERILGLPD